MSNKKIVIILVEGPSDDEALAIFFEEYFSDKVAHVHIMRGDVTSDIKVQPNTIISRINKELKSYMEPNGLKPADIERIIHIVDTDGAYVSDEYIHHDETANKVKYTTEGIYTDKVDKISSRNIRKVDNLNKLLSTGSIRKIPYQVFYMSCNLDHVLHDKMNSTDEEKEEDAFRFARTYKNDIDGFIQFISTSEFSQVSDYKQTWEYIKTDNNSLQRNTNIGIAFDA